MVQSERLENKYLDAASGFGRAIGVNCPKSISANNSGEPVLDNTVGIDVEAQDNELFYFISPPRLLFISNIKCRA